MTDLISQHLDIWTTAIASKAIAGRGTSDKQTAYGIKKLRELILELAVRGKLVPQDPNDEPARELLEKIAAEKECLVKEEKIKKQNSLPEINDDEKSFGLPSGWEWVRLQDISAYIQRGKGPKYADHGQVRVISQKCIQWYGFDLLQAKYVDDDSITSYQPERFLVENDLLWNSTGTGTVGRINVLAELKPNSLVADSHVTVIRPLIINSNFIWCYISAPGIQQRIEPGSEKTLVSGSTNQVELNTSEVIRLVVPIPPLAEQHRIVARVDELMALCDQLEQQQTDSIAAHQTLVQALLDTLIQAADATEFEQAWTRIAGHFDSLLTTEASIGQLKKNLLQLAVMGKLVPQDPNDEPASSLLLRINNELCSIENIKELPKLKRDSSTVDPKEFQFNIPKNWIWCELQDISLFTNGKAHEQFVTDDSNYILINSRFVSNSGETYKYVTERLSPLLKGDIAIVMSDVPDGKALVRCYVIDNSDRYTLNQRIGGIRTASMMSVQYLALVLDRNPYYLQYDDGKKQTNLKKIQILSCPIPLPPLKEQHRIIAKVDELMALCDTLKARIAAAQTIQLQLADAIVEQAVA